MTKRKTQTEGYMSVIGKAKKRKVPLVEREAYYAVKVTRTDGTAFFSCSTAANNGEDGRALYFHRHDARAHADRVAEALNISRRRVKAVKVRVTIEEAA